MSAPQNVTERYVNALLRNGSNDRYEIENIQQNISTVSNIPVGKYFVINIKIPTEDFKLISGLGATPCSALQRALEKDGVTFR